MALKKITTADIGSKGVQAIQGNTLVGDAQKNKEIFDRLVTEVVADVVNGMVDTLTSEGGAAEINSKNDALVQDETEKKKVTVQEFLDKLAEGVKTVAVDEATGNFTVTQYNGTSKAYNVAGEGGAPVAGKSTTVTATLLASGWADKGYDLAIDGVTATSYQELLPAIGIGETELTALQGANIVDNGQEPGVMKLKAMGDVPEVDIPVRVVLRGD